MTNVEKLEQATGIKVKFNAALTNEAFAYYTVTTVEGKYILDIKVNCLTRDISILFPDGSEKEMGDKALVKSQQTPDGPMTRISGDFIKMYTYPRLAGWMAAYYIEG
jgi:hypothetical protein